MEKRFEGKVAFVTGAATGMGQAMAVRLASEGALVGVNHLPTVDPSETLKGIKDAGGEGFSVVVVNEVEKGSPAAEAGMQEEDIITAIDGRPVKEFTMTELRKVFMQDGKEYLISLKRGQRELQTKLKLRRMI